MKISLNLFSIIYSIRLFFLRFVHDKNDEYHDKFKMNDMINMNKTDIPPPPAKVEDDDENDSDDTPGADPEDPKEDKDGKDEGDDPEGEAELPMSEDITDDDIEKMETGEVYELKDGFYRKNDEGKLDLVKEKEVKDDDSGDTKDKKVYDLGGGKKFNKSKMAAHMNKYFGEKDFFQNCDDKTFEKHAKLFIDAEAGKNKKNWTKEYANRDKTLAEEKRKFSAQKAHFQTELQTSKNTIVTLNANLEKQKEIAGIELDKEDEDYTEKLLEKRDAIKSVKETQEKIKAEQNNQQLFEFYKNLNVLQLTFPEMMLEDEFQSVMNDFNAGKKDEDDIQVRKAYALFTLINDAMAAQQKPETYYKLNKFKYPAFAEEKKEANPDVNKLIKEAKQFKKKQDSSHNSPKGSWNIAGSTQPKNPNGLPGKDREEKLRGIYKGKIA